VSLPCTVFEIEIWVENRRFELTTSLFGAPFGVTPLEFRRDLWHQKTRVHALHGLLYGVVCVILHLAVLVQYRCMTDGRTDDDSIFQYSIVSLGKNDWIGD